MHITPEQAVGIIKEMLLVREGETITPELAEERARNCAAVLVDTTIGEPDRDLLVACEAALAYMIELEPPVLAGETEARMSFGVLRLRLRAAIDAARGGS